jgi:hypothetical protein
LPVASRNEPMIKNIKLVVIILIFFIAAVCPANPIVVGMPSGGKYSLATNTGLAINLAADFIALCLGFFVIKNIKAVATWRFVPYFVIVFFGGIVIDVIAIVPVKLFFMFTAAGNMGMLILFLLAGLFLYIYNSWLSELFFDLELSEKIIIGIIMALLTNPVIGYIIESQ